uniref:ACB domain-containing protein n=1 Tax=Macrostomum lignano TaxID=282301 RepID=A0A1I8FFH1_9PLAT
KRRLANVAGKTSGRQTSRRKLRPGKHRRWQTSAGKRRLQMSAGKRPQANVGLANVRQANFAGKRPTGKRRLGKTSAGKMSAGKRPAGKRRYPPIENALIPDSVTYLLNRIYSLHQLGSILPMSSISMKALAPAESLTLHPTAATHLANVFVFVCRSCDKLKETPSIDCLEQLCCSSRNDLCIVPVTMQIRQLRHFRCALCPHNPTAKPFKKTIEGCVKHTIKSHSNFHCKLTCLLCYGATVGYSSFHLQEFLHHVRLRHAQVFSDANSAKRDQPLALFDAAVGVIRSLPKEGAFKPSNELLLRLYSLYKQATEGPCRQPRPGFWDPVSRYKWDAWNSLGDMQQETAMLEYVEELKKVIETMPHTPDVEKFLGTLGSFYEVDNDEDNSDAAALLPNGVSGGGVEERSEADEGEEFCDSLDRPSAAAPGGPVDSLVWCRRCCCYNFRYQQQQQPPPKQTSTAQLTEALRLRPRLIRDSLAQLQADLDRVHTRLDGLEVTTKIEVAVAAFGKRERPFKYVVNCVIMQKKMVPDWHHSLLVFLGQPD